MLSMNNFKPYTAKRLAVIVTVMVIVLIFMLRIDDSPDLRDAMKSSRVLSRSSGGDSDNYDNEDEDTRIGSKNRVAGGLSFGSGKNSEEIELLRKLTDATDKLLLDQEERLLKLENDREKLERQLLALRTPNKDATLRERLAFMFPYDQNKKFPAYIWQTWKYGLNDERFGNKYKTGEEQWAMKNPGFVHELFNDDTASAIIHHLYLNVPEVVKTYDLLPNIILKMDFFRYLMLFAKGGIYADVDTLPLQAIPNWIPDNVSPNQLGMIIGIDSDPDTPNWRQKYSRRLQFANWVIQAKAGHPILREIIATITEDTLEKARLEKLELPPIGSNSVRDIAIMNWTGEGVWTDTIFKYMNDYVLSGVYSKITWKDFTRLDVPKLVSDILVLPVTCFSPGSVEMGAQDIDHPLAFVQHYFENLYKEGENHEN